MAMPDVEQEVFLEAMRLKYGYDFRGYNRASLARRLALVRKACGAEHTAQLIAMALRQPEIAAEFIRHMSIVHSDLFRDPAVFRNIRTTVCRDLSTYPFFKVWHAGCASGEEVYSLAIILHECGLYGRAQIYATDFNACALDQAVAGRFDLDRWSSFERNYREAGGSRSLDEHFERGGRYMHARPHLGQHVTFAQHNLVCDGVFGEMNLIMCRNVMIYFTPELKTRVLRLFHDSLAHRGFLCIGRGETLEDAVSAGHFIDLSASDGLYRAWHAPAEARA
ncbi:protein-glutamate O-methyltransferase CheR [Methyloversatilis sp.]|uniref:CheR family methyltransferase n=1 Tax=Methyloversatilis sp. TaxID=2569862 RepID=UPI0035AFE72E